jgi:hypothetical protein
VRPAGRSPPTIHSNYFFSNGIYCGSAMTKWTTLGHRNLSRAVREVQDAQPCGGVARSSPRCSKTEFYTSGQTDAPASQRGFLNNGPHGAHATLPTSLSRKPVAV